MRENLVTSKIAKGENVPGVFIDLDSSAAAEGMAHAGYGFLLVDLQHGVIDTRSAVSILTAISTTDCMPFVRVPGNEPAAIMQALDFGAMGVVCPLINTADQAARFVDAMRYPPQGSRSWGPFRAAIYAGENYTQEANDTLMAIAQIETKEAMDNLDAILATPGLDGVLVGPNDLGFSYGNWPQAMPEDPQVVEAIKTIAAKCRDHGVIPGIHSGDAAMARQMFDWGYRFSTISTDMGLMIKAAKESLAALEG
ncbi:HpcH/HpaI aldolase family protein [Aestuariispira ectoiniformans]|uniref:HpcH/HpaI aldolase family protein n=1 Tax=Aestuariispira ectoiniformans TaxID=2775080 RepID=UPI00223B38B9|nr:aldolase/citrate lyase family protein [Aestuariispira ectoiniformans]